MVPECAPRNQTKSRSAGTAVGGPIPRYSNICSDEKRTHASNISSDDCGDGGDGKSDGGSSTRTGTGIDSSTNRRLFDKVQSCVSSATISTKSNRQVAFFGSKCLVLADCTYNTLIYFWRNKYSTAIETKFGMRKENATMSVKK